MPGFDATSHELASTFTIFGAADVHNHTSDYQQIHESSDAPADDSSADVKPPSPPLRPLTTLKWPYVPEESAYPDPLKRDDPKPLQLHQYEAIGESHTRIPV